jgi:tetratricopeptide (TPR) repeat protein
MTPVAIIYNNLGVQYHEKGRWEEALEMFQGSLQLMMHVSNDVIHDDYRQMVIGSDVRVQRAHQRWQQSLVSESIITKKATHKEKGGVDDFVFTKAIEMADSSFERYEIKSAVVLFNVALTYHLFSLEVPGQMEHNRHKAHQLYNMSYQIASVLHLQGRPEVSLCRLLTALLNNLGKLAHDAGQYKASRSYFAALSGLLNCLPESENAMVVEERRGLLLNSFILDQPWTAAAA